jgi:hypothetical protein
MQCVLDFLRPNNTEEQRLYFRCHEKEVPPSIPNLTIKAKPSNVLTNFQFPQ